ncbi:MAG: hypothetical protein KKF85_02240 [Gammaproteobacteria bacterium]|nr:hypothetical protein [Gammaproteobacteria bacterium]MBU3988685.1 hypothetical protein [Gammaproteobacteria bacterium]MBU4004673.1 hypothetical protein [Gammaproteobacteria bacterium]MBU4021276.1 hypothetical protein [Gammaproteobacteria bacterium]MBU4096293.1 hypothetical protein [Gammaproteobacteria bacterium]
MTFRSGDIVLVPFLSLSRICPPASVALHDCGSYAVMEPVQAHYRAVEGQ